MNHTIKWWSDGEKAVGIEYRSLLPSDVEPIIRDLLDKSHARRIEIRDEEGAMVAHYPDAKKHRPPAP